MSTQDGMTRRQVQKLAWVIGATLTYSVVRYIVLGDVAAAQLPAYIANKAVSFASVTCLALYFWSVFKLDSEGKFLWGKAFFHLLILHVALSFALFRPEYYKAFFDVSVGTLTLWGSLSILTGALGLYLSVTSAQFQSSATRGHCYQLVVVFSALHLVFMGGAGWFAPDKWLGGLPPITLLSFIVLLGAFYFSLREKSHYALKGKLPNA